LGCYLQTQIGCESGRWPVVLLKELIDNALDACEAAEVAPAIDVSLGPDHFTVQDNGPGIPADVVGRAADFTTRTSSKRWHVAPTRGQLGNALKCCMAAPAVLFPGNRGAGFVVESDGESRRITIRLDEVAQEPVPEVLVVESAVKTGTLTRLDWPGVASCLGSSGPGVFNSRASLLHSYALFNPHLCLSLNGQQLLEPTPWQKWAGRSSPHWYTVEQLAGLIGAHVAHERAGRGASYSVRELVVTFDGLSGSAKAKKVVDVAGLSGQRLADLVTGEDVVDRSAVARLLEVMQEATRPTKPQALGVIGEERLVTAMRALFGADEEVTYRRRQGVADGMPFVVEVGFSLNADPDADWLVPMGINWSPALTIPSHAISSILQELEIDSYDPVVLAIHLTTPRVAFTDTGKSRADMPPHIQDAIFDAVRLAAKWWTSLKKEERREDRRSDRLAEEARRKQQRKEVTVKAAAQQVMAEAYREASGEGTYPANARQVMYSARRRIVELTGNPRPWKNSAYFTQRLLPDFIEAHPALTANWDVVFDNRGNLVEPHTRRRIPLGTVAVREYIAAWEAPQTTAPTVPTIGSDVLTCGPAGRYRFALFVEKEGFNELLEMARFAERYDLAIMSTKGMSVIAARALVERLSEEGVTILVLHDFDQAGLTILRTLGSDTRRYKFTTRPKIIDLGLRLADVRARHLEREAVGYRSKKDPRETLAASGATLEEQGFLVSGGRAKDWTGHRVELNAMPSDQFVGFLDAKLREAGVVKVMPDRAALVDAYRRALSIQFVNASLPQLAEQARGQAASAVAPPDLERLVCERLAQHPGLPWDEALAEIALGYPGPVPSEMPV
jgi:DNA topoisomerase VI subunit B